MAPSSQELEPPANPGRFRLLVTYFIEKKGWSVDQILQTRLTEDEATTIMRAEAQRWELRASPFASDAN
jgi:hypothetical protein